MSLFGFVCFNSHPDLKTSAGEQLSVTKSTGIRNFFFFKQIENPLCVYIATFGVVVPYLIPFPYIEVEAHSHLL